MQVQRAQAVGWALAPAGITLGAGAFLAGALVVGSVATGLGLEYGDEIKQAGKDVWNSATDLVKDSMLASVEAAQSAGEKVVSFSQDVMDFFTSKAKDIAGAGTAIKARFDQASAPVSEVAPPWYSPDTTNYPPSGTMVNTAYPLSTVYMNSSRFNQQFATDSPNRFFISDYAGVGAIRTIEISYSTTSFTVNLIVDGNLSFGHTANGGWLRTSSTKLNKFTNLSYESIGMNLETFKSALRGLHTAESYVAFLTSMGLDNIFVGKHADVLANYNTANNRVATQDIPNMKDAGLVIPTQDVVAHPVAQPDINLTYNPATDTYTFPDGTVYTGDIDISFPIPYVGEGGAILVQSGDGSITNVYTGEVVSPPTTTEPPPTTGDTPKSIDWSKLKVAVGTLTTVFPFSIPWDVFRLLSVLNVPPETPVFNININKTVTIFGTSIPIEYDFDIDFSAFDPLAAVGRWGLILVFDISIIMALRRLTPD